MNSSTAMPAPDRQVFGWDIGGAHVKACRLVRGEVLEVVQWACPLWQGLDHLDRVLLEARARWPQLAAARHAVTMTGEMVDLFEHREDGVRRIAERVCAGLAAAEPVQFFAGDAAGGAAGASWCGPADVARHWAGIASANWLATACHVAHDAARGANGASASNRGAPGDGDGVLVDIGSTTTDLIAFAAGRVLTTSRSDAERLATGELVYHGVVRTPLCAVAPRVAWRGAMLNVMNEFFASAADVYRLTGELDPAHDLYPAADNAGKDAPATRRRLARMIGLDEREATPAEWLAFAHTWRAAQVAELSGQLQRVLALHRLGPSVAIVGAGCGDFLVAELATQALGPGAVERCEPYVARAARVAAGALPHTARWAQVCAPCVAVASLLDKALF
jgi:(4-(4-[2-(gamma-L-glutamylamino)ethyl]phenoxymethyl)furan-2-yl)methanamine synthase